MTRLPSGSVQGEESSRIAVLWYLLCASATLFLGLAPFGGAIIGFALLSVIFPIAYFKSRKRPAIFGELLWPVVALVVAALVSGFLATERGQGMGNAILLAVMLFVSFGAADLLVRERRSLSHLALPALVLGATAASLYAVYKSVIVGVAHAETPFVGYNGFGTLLIFSGTVGVGYLLQRTDRWRLLAIPYGALILTALVATLSRGSWVGMGVVLLVFASRLRKGLLPWLVIIGILLGGFVVGDERLVERVKSFQLSENMNRITVWKDSLRLVRDYPVFGVGLGQFPAHFPNYVTDPRARWGAATPHNLVLTIWTELGSVGLVIFLVLVCMVLRMAIELCRKGDTLYIGLCAALVGMLIRDLFDHTLHSVHIGALFWFAAGLVRAFHAYEQNLTSSP